MKWPKEIPVGSLSVGVMEVDQAEFLHIDDDCIATALYNGDMLVIAKAVDRTGNMPRLKCRVDNDVCHEIIHAWEDIIMGHDRKFNEFETQSLANALHQLIQAILEENEVEDDGLEIQRTEIGSETASSNWEMGKEVATSH